MKTAKYLSLLALSALLVGCGPTSNPTSTPTDPSVDPTTEPPVFVAPESISLIGSFAESSWTNDIDFTSNDEGRTWVLESYPLYAGDMWKIRKDHNWGNVGTDNWGATYLDESSLALFEDVTSDNNNIKVLTSAYYTITFNYVDQVISATLDEEIQATWEDAVATSLSVYDSVNAGSFRYRSAWTEEPEWSNEYTYEYGNDKNGSFVYIKEVHEWSEDGFVDEVYGHTENGGVYGIIIEDDGTFNSSYSSNIGEHSLYGPEVSLFSYSLDVNGAQGLLNALLEIYKASPVSESFFADGVYVVHTQFVFVNEGGYSEYNKLYDINAQCTFHENGALESIFVTSDAYTNLVEDLELGWVLSDESVLDGTEVIEGTLTVGERHINNPVGDVSSLFYSSFDVIDAEGNVVTNVEMGAGSYIELYIGNKAPETASSRIDTIKTEVVEGDPDSINAQYSSWGGSLSISSSVEGTYKVKVYSANVTKYIDVVITAAYAEYINTWFSTPTFGGYHDTLAEVQSGDTVTLYVGTSVILTPNIQPSEADQEVLVEIEGDAVTSTELFDFKMSPWGDEQHSWKLVGTKTGTVTVKVTAVKAPSIIAVYNIEVVAAPELSSLVAKEWITGYNGMVQASVKFHPTTDPKTGTLDVYSSQDGTSSYDYKYDETTREFVLYTDGAVASGETLRVLFTDSYRLFVKAGEWAEYTLDVKTEFFDLEGSWETYQFIQNENLGNSMINISIGSGAKTISFGFTTTDKEFNTVVSVDIFEEELTLTQTANGYDFSFDTSTIDGTDVSNLKISVSADFKVMTVSFNSATYGALTTELTRG